jgi:hypothetical protein
MALQGKTTEWLRIIVAVVLLTSTGVAAFTSYKAGLSFDSLRSEVQRGNEAQEKWNSRIEAQLHLQEQRVMTLEQNKFTRIDGESLSLRISDNVKSIAVLQTDQAYIKNTVSTIAEKMDRLLERRP